jgi:hypothetical protein
MESEKRSLISFGIASLLIVSLLGMLMRYKIGFDFPFFSQKYIQHAHSHFAFAGWIGHMLLVFMVYFLTENRAGVSLKKFNLIIVVNLLIAYAMLISFFIQGYGIFSIVVSTCSVFVNYWFAIVYYRALKTGHSDHPSAKWFTAALVFNVLSSLGTFYLAYMMGTKTVTQNWYLGSVYFFLHFQYNGWFFFAIMGLIIHQLRLIGLDIDTSGSIFRLFVWSAVPAFLLSVLWLNLPIWVLLLLAIAAIMQLIAWFKFGRQMFNSADLVKKHFSGFAGKVLLFAAVAVSIKFILQLGSTIPAVSQYAFGFRSIVIAYLHLVLLGFVTVFLVAYLFVGNYIKPGIHVRIAVSVFLIGIFMNELILLLQGLGSFSYTLIPYANEGLFGVAMLMSLSLFYLLIALLRQRRFE